MAGADNEAQIEFWNGQAGRTWADAQVQMDVMLAPLSAIAIDKANPQPGERAIDVGCGCGDTSVAMAQRGAAVWGVDISEPMLDRAKERAKGRKDLAFSKTDAATQAYTPDHPLLFSRFGVMFFADPIGAFKNLRTALTDDGRMVFICWQAPSANPWMSIAARALQPFLTAPPSADPRAPGPFAFADRDYLIDVLTQAGFANVRVEGATTNLHLGDNLDEVIRFQGEIGPIARALAELQGEERDKALRAVRDALSAHMTSDGLDLQAACWLVSATSR
ncbi:MAG: class I SAM-dependent methyltransferase [Proteobacteria bacterium]|nr:class I SAM-dependent methyltransferase [Pseudomonadota bacterium]